MNKIGVIGGGQLGMFLCEAINELGYYSIAYDPNSKCSASYTANEIVVGAFDDEDKLKMFCEKCDLITYEFENINSSIVDRLSRKYNIVQKAYPLVLSSHRHLERSLKPYEVKQPRYYHLITKTDLKKIKLNYPYLVKTNSLGYDGKGQYLIKKEKDLLQLDFDKIDYIAEEYINFQYEFSLVAIRTINNEVLVYPPFINITKEGILAITNNTIELPETVVDKATRFVKETMGKENIYGLLCCEFMVKNDDVYFNELACRPHNTAHITMDMNVTSQYKNHILALLGNELGSIKQCKKGFMVNILGQDLEYLNDFLNKNKSNAIKYYDYHKEARTNRKVGHLVIEDLKYYDEWLEYKTK